MVHASIRSPRFWLALALGLACASTAAADEGRNKGRRGSKPKPHRIETIRPQVHGSIGYGLGVGARLDIAIVPDGFLERAKIEDELAISPGFEFFFLDFNENRDGTFDDNHTNVSFAFDIALQWNLFVHDKWSVFPEIGLAVLIGDDYGYHDHGHGRPRNTHAHVYVDPLVGGGARMHFGDRLALVMRLNFPFGFQIGLAF